MSFSTLAFSTGQVLTAAHMRSIFENFVYLKGRSTDAEILLENVLEVAGSLYLAGTTGAKYIQVEVPAGTTAAETAILGLDGYTEGDPDGLQAGDALKIKFSVSNITDAGTTAASTSREHLGGIYAELDSTAGGGNLNIYVVNNAGSSINAISITSTGLVTFQSVRVDSTAPFPVNAQYLQGYQRHSGLWSTGTLAAPTTSYAQVCDTTLDRTGIWEVRGAVSWQVDAAGAQGVTCYVDNSTAAVTRTFRGDLQANSSVDYGPVIPVLGRFSGTSGQVIRLMANIQNSTAANPGATIEGDLLLAWRAVS